MTPTFPFNSRLFRPNMVTLIPIVKYFHSFFVAYFMADVGVIKTLVNLLLLKFLMLWDLGCPTFTEDKSAFTSPPSPLKQNPHQYPLSLPLIPTKSRRDCSNVRTLRTLHKQEKKSSTSQNMIILDGVSWHPRYVLEFERPKLDILSPHVR